MRCQLAVSHSGWKSPWSCGKRKLIFQVSWPSSFPFLETPVFISLPFITVSLLKNSLSGQLLLGRCILNSQAREALCSPWRRVWQWSTTMFTTGDDLGLDLSSLILYPCLPLTSNLGAILCKGMKDFRSSILISFHLEVAVSFPCLKIRESRSSYMKVPEMLSAKEFLSQSLVRRILAKQKRIIQILVILNKIIKLQHM